MIESDDRCSWLIVFGEEFLYSWEVLETALRQTSRKSCIMVILVLLVAEKIVSAIFCL